MGGGFALPAAREPAASRPPFLTSDELLFVNARSAIAHVIRALAPAHVWLPSYLCTDLLGPVRDHEVRFYELTSALDVTSLDWLEQVQRGDLVIVIDYFGFPFGHQVQDLAEERGAWVLADASQALLTGGVGTHAHFTVFSPRKFLGVPDGGVLRQGEVRSLSPTRLKPPPADWWLKALAALTLRRDFDHGNGARDWFPLYQEVERQAPIGELAMSELTRTLLEGAFDYHEIARRRRQNYGFLASKLASVALFGTLPSAVVPLGFPIVVNERDRIREALFANEIYPAVHWAIDGAVPRAFRDSHRLSRQIMTLPCDQRYGSGDMARVASCVLEALG